MGLNDTDKTLRHLHKVVARLVTKYKYRGVDPDDLRQSCYVAIIEALPKFDSSRGSIEAFAYVQCQRTCWQLVKGARKEQHQSLDAVCDGIHERHEVIAGSYLPECLPEAPKKGVFYRGQYRSIAECAELSGLKPDTIYRRLRRSWSARAALETPVRQ